jgi:hypothetical protein
VQGELINPNSNLSINQEKVLAELQKWTTDKGILAAAGEHCDISPKQFMLLALRVEATIEHRKPEWKALANPLTPRETAILALEFLNNRTVRQQIARYTAAKMRIPKPQAMRDLWDMREFLLKQYSVEEVQAAKSSGLIFQE